MLNCSNEDVADIAVLYAVIKVIIEEIVNRPLLEKVSNLRWGKINCNLVFAGKKVFNSQEVMVFGEDQMNLNRVVFFSELENFPYH